MNSLIYDSIYGFSTKPFSPTSNILFVNDYCEGQKFISSFTASLADRMFNNDFPA